jgi:hypothetical protein
VALALALAEAEAEALADEVVVVGLSRVGMLRVAVEVLLDAVAEAVVVLPAATASVSSAPRPPAPTTVAAMPALRLMK